MLRMKKSLLGLLVVVFFSTFTIISCGKQGGSEETQTEESAEHPSDSTEHPSDTTEHEHPSEHPTDSTSN
ncbi:MAG: hypothetical protein ACOYXA_02585 [Bacteroidota bacterium]